MDTSGKPKQSTQGPLVLWHGMTLRQLLRFFGHSPILHWRKAHHLLSLPFLAGYNSLMGLAERAIYGRAIEQTELTKPPLFVIGHWRSGTTLLHNLLSQDPQFGYPNMYQVIFPNHFLLTEKVVGRLTAPLVPKSRPMDNIPTSWEMPQEEDIAMALLTCLSPYMLLAQPDRNDLVRPLWDLSLLSEKELSFWKREYLTLLKKVTYRERRQLVVKSPVNTLRIPLLLDLFPDAQFVHITRNPFDVFHSTMHLRRTMFRENSLGFPHLRDGEEAVYWVQEFTHRTYQRDRKLLAPGQLHELRFEDLERDPLGELEQLYQTLGLEGWDQMQSIIEPQVPALRRYKKNKFQYSRAQMDECYSRLRRLFEDQNYPHPAEANEAVAA